MKTVWFQQQKLLKFLQNSATKLGDMEDDPGQWKRVAFVLLVIIMHLADFVQTSLSDIRDWYINELYNNVMNAFVLMGIDNYTNNTFFGKLSFWRLITIYFIFSLNILMVAILAVILTMRELAFEFCADVEQNYGNISKVSFDMWLYLFMNIFFL